MSKGSSLLDGLLVAAIYGPMTLLAIGYQLLVAMAFLGFLVAMVLTLIP